MSGCFSMLNISQIVGGMEPAERLAAGVLAAAALIGDSGYVRYGDAFDYYREMMVTADPVGTTLGYLASRFSPTPIRRSVLLNCVPKSGTHLLHNLFAMFVDRESHYEGGFVTLENWLQKT